MLKNIIRRNIRQPLAALMVLLFVTGLTVVLCCLHKSGQEELSQYEETYASVPVFFKVTDLDGSKPKDLNGISGWVIDLFEDDWPTPLMSPYAGEIHSRVSLSGQYYLIDENGRPVLDRFGLQETRSQTTTGVSSTRVAEELTEGWGGKIYWNEGYDESILLSNDFVCIVPESMRHYSEVGMEYVYSSMPPGVGLTGDLVTTEFSATFQVIGYYTDPGNSRIYCPYETLALVHAHLRKPKVFEELGAILADNSQLARLKEDASYWFAEPNPTGEKTPWGKYGFEYYFYALDIDDTMLTNLETNMKNSLRLNQLASAVIFTLSAGAGFLTGFLVIRSRKREIALMRTMGASQTSIFGELALEQMLCILAGILIGGSYTLWQPGPKLAIFGGIYLIGLSVALLIFLRKNLLTIIKEDE